MLPFASRLLNSVRQHQTPMLIGLDPRWQHLPESLRPSNSQDFMAVAKAYQRFCEEVIDAIADLAAALKPQAAFFEQLGPAGMVALGEVLTYARVRAPDLPIILDAKRNDIGSTASAYAEGFLGVESPWGMDALTVNPYLGDDSLAPFVKVAEARQAGIFVLVKTSNPGSAVFQDRLSDGVPMFEHVARHVEELAQQSAGDRGYGLAGAVIGATYPQQLVDLRRKMPHTWFLVPGMGAQGGAVSDVVGAFDEKGGGALINSSRHIIFAYERSPYRERFGQKRWQDAVRAAAQALRQELRENTPAMALAVS